MASDEDFVENPFYNALMREFKDLHGKASERRCVICVPQASSLKNRNILRKRAELGLHILTPSPMQHLTKGLYDCVQSGYSVIVDREKGCIRGFKGIGTDFVARILSEEQCYDESGRSFTLLFIDRPLGTEMDSFDRSPPKLDYNIVTLSAASCEEFLRESLPPSEVERIISTYKKSIEQYYHTYFMLKDYIDDLVGKLQKLVNKTLRDDIMKVAPVINRKDAAAALEVYGHNILFGKIFDFLKDEVYKERDETIRKNMTNVKPLTKVDGLDVSTAKFPTAEEFLLKMPTQPSPLQQLVCFARAVQGLKEDITKFHKEQLRLGRTNCKTITLTADDTLNLVIHVLCEKRAPYLRTMLAYISKFCTTIPDPSLQYSLTTFEAAIKYLENLNDETSKPAGKADINRLRSRASSSDDPTDDYDIPDRVTLMTLNEEMEHASNNPGLQASNSNSFLGQKLRVSLEMTRDLGASLSTIPARTSPGRSGLKGFRNGVSYSSHE